MLLVMSGCPAMTVRKSMKKRLAVSGAEEKMDAGVADRLSQTMLDTVS